MDLSRLDRNRTLLGAAASILLIASILFFPWFTLDDSAERVEQDAWLCGEGDTSCTGFETFPILRWLLLLAALAPAILGYILARGHKLSYPPGEMTMVAGAAAFVLILYNGIIDRPVARPGPRVRHQPGLGLLAGADQLAGHRGRGVPALAGVGRQAAAQGPRHRLEIASARDGCHLPRRPRSEPAGSQPRARARPGDRGRGAGRRPLGRAGRQGGGRPGGGRRDAPAARDRADGRHRRDRRGREGRGADALQRRADRRRQPARGRHRGRPARGHQALRAGDAVGARGDRAGRARHDVRPRPVRVHGEACGRPRDRRPADPRRAAHHRDRAGGRAQGVETAAR